LQVLDVGQNVGSIAALDLIGNDDSVVCPCDFVVATFTGGIISQPLPFPPVNVLFMALPVLYTTNPEYRTHHEALFQRPTDEELVEGTF
jgi:hypothetical protein